MRRAVIVVLGTLALVACSGSSSPPADAAIDAVPSFPACANPDWLRELIARLEAQPPGNPGYSVTQYTYYGMTVFYLPAQCCDLFSELLDTCGEMICAPSGGIAGSGDGRCPDFYDSRTNEVPIWSDPRGE